MVDNCIAVLFTNIKTHYIDINNSRIELRNASISQGDKSHEGQFVFFAQDSVAVATNVNLVSKNGMRLKIVVWISLVQNLA